MFPSDLAAKQPPASETGPEWLHWLSPLLSDLEANQALASALVTLQSRQPNRGDRAFAEAKRTLAIRPYDGALWVALALLQASRDPHDPTVAEALKMAYFVAPNDARLMPLRLDTATRFDAVSIPDLREAVQGDVRLMMTRGDKPLREAVRSAYRRSSDIGKAFIEATVQAIDPSLLPLVRG
ncbi:hypothetical protein [Bradyrhizobium jicamae]|nr:hypothetical protein [Bradyrhizobium jicamae]MBR0934909.1 hypothetical protein [Bradyrhizobium jicamae]